MAQAHPPKPVAAFDLDGTFFRRHMLELLFDTSFGLGLFSKASQAHYEDLTIDFRDRKITHAEYSATLVRIFDDNIRGKPVRDVKSVAKRVAREYHAWIYTFTRSLFDTVADTHERITITGAVKEVVAEILRYWPFEATYTTEMAIKNCVYTGKRHKVHVEDKAATLRKHALAHSSPFRDSLAIGDTESDTPMLASVECPIAFNPNDALARTAEERGWPVVIERKDCIYVVHKGSYRRFFMDEAADAVRHVLSLFGTPQP